MKSKTIISAALAVALSLPALSSMAKTNSDLLGQAVPASRGGRTIEVTPDTRYVNVQGGEIVTFTSGGKAFTWDFDGPTSLTSFDLNQVAPQGLLAHPVKVYVSPNPLYTRG